MNSVSFNPGVKDFIHITKRLLPSSLYQSNSQIDDYASNRSDRLHQGYKPQAWGTWSMLHQQCLCKNSNCQRTEHKCHIAGLGHDQTEIALHDVKCEAPHTVQFIRFDNKKNRKWKSNWNCNWKKILNMFLEQIFYWSLKFWNNDIKLLRLQ